MKVIRITSCENCPHAGVIFEDEPKAWCTWLEEVIIDAPTIPKWCPLEDAE